MSKARGLVTGHPAIPELPGPLLMEQCKLNEGASRCSALRWRARVRSWQVAGTHATHPHTASIFL